MAILSQLRRRRVPQFLGIYLGASWAVVQFVDWMTKRYLLSHHLTDVALIALVSLTPAVLLLAYYHGAPGRQPLGRAGKVVVPLNVLVTVGLLTLFLHGRDLSAAAKRVTVTDEDGQQVTRLVPTESARRKVALFFWTNDTGDADQEWLRYGLPLVLARDLRQNLFLDAWDPFRGDTWGFFPRLRRAGYEDGLGAPVALQRQIAADWHLDHFVDGRFDRDADGALRATVSIFEAGGGPAVAAHVVVGRTVSDVVDQLTPLLLGDVGVPTDVDRLEQDLPVADVLTGDPEALRFYVEGRTARLLRNDLPGAATAFHHAVEADPSFAIAHIDLGNVLFTLGDREQARAALDAALRHDYKLTEGDRFVAKGMGYLLTDQIEKRTALFEMWVELHPSDITAMYNLASVYKWEGNRIDDARAVYQRILDVAPTETHVLREMATIDLLQGRPEVAVETLERYRALHPDDHGVLLQLGGIHRNVGELEAAREAYEKASLMATGVVQPAINLADVALRLGEFDEAEQRIREAERIAADPQQTSLALRARIGMLRMRGRFEEAFALVEPLYAAEQAYSQPVDALFTSHVNNVDLYHGTGRDAAFTALIDTWIETLGTPFDTFLLIGHMQMAIIHNDADAIQRHRTTIEEALEAWKREDMRFLTAMAHGSELQARQQYRAAIEQFEQSLAFYRSSVQSGGQNSFEVELLRLMAVSHRAAGEFDRAEERIRKALKLMPALPDLHLELAKIADARGRPDEAHQHAQQALVVWVDADAPFEPAAEARALAAG